MTHTSHPESLESLGIFYGYVSVFDHIDTQGDCVHKGAFVETLGWWKEQCQMPPLLWAHDVASPIGRIQDLYEDAYGLFVQAQLTLGVQKAKEAMALLYSRAISGLSMGFRLKKARKDTFKRCRVIEEIELWEVSLVALPANREAVILRIS